MKRALIIGATSAIATATARNLAARGGALYLLGRDAARLSTMREDLLIGGAETVDCAAFDALDYPSHGPLMARIQREFRPDFVLLAWGELDAAADRVDDAEAMRTLLNINGVSVASLLCELCRDTAAQPVTIALLGSPAGLRGRAANFGYGAGKAMAMLVAEGLRARHADTPLHVMTVIPGRVDTPMTRDFDKGPLWTTPERVARDLLRGAERRRDVVYTPGYWRLILLLIRLLPEPLLRRLRA